MPEQRLIDANVLSDKVAESKHNNPHQQGIVRVNHRNEHDHFLRMISIAPTVDAVEVVRCKECEHCDWYTKTYELIGLSETKYWCSANKGPAVEVRAEHFCSYGERRADD